MFGFFDNYTDHTTFEVQLPHTTFAAIDPILSQTYATVRFVMDGSVNTYINKPLSFSIVLEEIGGLGLAILLFGGILSKFFLT